MLVKLAFDDVDDVGMTISMVRTDDDGSATRGKSLF
jgi:hypothetical protein